jgi:hypothetical protein
MQSTRFMLRKRASILVVIAALTAASCAVRLIGDYDDAIDKGVTDIQQKAEEYWAKLQSTPATPIDQSFYDGINASLAVLSSRAKSSPKYTIIVQQVALLKSQFDDFQKVDKLAQRPIASVAFITSGQAGIEVSIESILKLELALKRGSTSPPSPPSPSATK